MRMVFKMLVAGVPATLCASATFAQGCALCYNDAAATGPSALAALRHGILVLIIPPTLIFVTMLTTLYRRRNLYRESVEGVGEMPSRDASPVSEVILHLS
ncbi:MAG TPA: hypothetical protein VGS27_24440 [Candidatus Sulfotelmatobacter sp.]|nr:hypothetical protein [Candidatus Sulfotelmatobacter sp.]